LGDTKTAETPKETQRHRASASAGGVAGADTLAPAYDGVGNARLYRLLRSGALRRKLAISQPGDSHEREADLVADRLLLSSGDVPPTSISGPATVHRQCACGGASSCAHCAGDEEAALGIQRHEERGTDGPRHIDADAQHLVRRLGSGRPLEGALRTRFERGLARDLGDVRIHTSAEAARAARALDAQAFTVGRDIAFAADRFSPATPDGARLIAHELAHVVQQDAGARFIQRQQAKPGEVKGPAPPVVHQWPTTGVEIRNFPGYVLTENPDQLREQMVLLVAQGMEPGGLGAPIPPGINAPLAMESRLLSLPVDCAGQTDTIACVENRPAMKVFRVLHPIVDALHKEHEQFLQQFQDAAYANAVQTLNANETEAKKEGARYGIRLETVQRQRLPPGGVPDADAGVQEPVRFEDQFTMDSASPAGKTLQTNAQILLKRRQRIDELKEEQEKHVTYVAGGKGRAPQRKEDAQYALIGKDIQEKTRDYENLRAALSAQTPVLDRFAKLDSDTKDLADLANVGPGDTMAALLAHRISDTLSKIVTAKEELKDKPEKVWELKSIVGLTKASSGTDQDLVKTKLVDRKLTRLALGFSANCCSAS
jgi:hypothetical protein